MVDIESAFLVRRGAGFSLNGPITDGWGTHADRQAALLITDIALCDIDLWNIMNIIAFTIEIISDADTPTDNTYLQHTFSAKLC